MTISNCTEIKWVPYRPSNRVEGDIFEEKYCQQCVKDRDSDCPIHTAILWKDEVPEWVIPENAEEWPGDAKCTAFVPYPDKVPF